MFEQYVIFSLFELLVVVFLSNLVSEQQSNVNIHFVVEQTEFVLSLLIVIVVTFALEQRDLISEYVLADVVVQ